MELGEMGGHRIRYVLFIEKEPSTYAQIYRNAEVSTSRFHRARLWSAALSSEPGGVES